MQWRDILSSRVLVVVCIVGAFLLFAHRVFGDYVRAKKRTDELVDASNRVPGDHEVTLILFFAKWCPACKKCEGEWDAFVKQYHLQSSNLIRGFRVTCQTVDCSNYQSDEIAMTYLDQYHVEAFPSVVLVGAGPNGYLRMRGTITRATLESFVDTSVRGLA